MTEAAQRLSSAEQDRHIGDAAPERMVEEIEGRTIAGAARAVFIVAAVAANILAVNQLLNLQLFAGIVFIENRYLFLLAASLLPLVFLALPASKKASTEGVPWYDWALADPHARAARLVRVVG